VLCQQLVYRCAGPGRTRVVHWTLPRAGKRTRHCPDLRARQDLHAFVYEVTQSSAGPRTDVSSRCPKRFGRVVLGSATPDDSGSRPQATISYRRYDAANHAMTVYLRCLWGRWCSACCCWRFFDFGCKNPQHCRDCGGIAATSRLPHRMPARPGVPPAVTQAHRARRPGTRAAFRVHGRRRPGRCQGSAGVCEVSESNIGRAADAVLAPAPGTRPAVAATPWDHRTRPSTRV